MIGTPKTELLTWTAQTITHARTGAVRAAVSHNLVRGMDPEHVAESMQLIRNLNAAMGAS